MSDVKFMQPQRLTDNPDGGGLATANEVVDGQVNNIFPDISRIDRTNGEVSLRKVFVQAVTPNTEVFSGVHVIISLPPEDDRVSCVLFQTAGWDDERADAQELVERYLDASIITRMIPYDRQLPGQRAVIVLQRPELSLPDVGEVYVLTNESLDPVSVEFFRVQAVESEVQTFTDTTTGADFLARVITMTITQPLSQEFAGSQPNRLFVSADGKAIIRRTLVSDAARYKGTTALALDAAAGAVSLKVESVFAQLAPSAASEAAVTNAEVVGASALQDCATVAVKLAEPSVSWSSINTLRPWVKGTGVLVVNFSDFGGNRTYTEQADGTWLPDPALASFAIDSDPSAGTLSITRGSIGGSLWGLTATPAVAISKTSSTAEQRVTIGTRGYVYIQSCTPVPAPGSVVVSYRALGRWFELRDDGQGGLEGGQGVGAGSVDYASGTVVVTLGALPDIGSSVVFAWAGLDEYAIRTGDISIKPPSIRHTLSAGNCKPSTLTVSWTANSVAKSASDNGSGALTGDATGAIVYANGDLVIRPTVLPDPTSEFVIEYEAADVETEIYNPSKSGSTITLTAASAPVRPRSILVTYQQQTTVQGLTVTTTQQLADNGSGELVDADGNVKAGSAVNYTTGEITFNPDFTMISPVLNYERFESELPARVADPTVGYFASIARFGNWPYGAGTSAQPIGFVNGTATTLQYKQDSATDGAISETIDPLPLQIDLLPGIAAGIVPGSVLLSFGGRKWIDRNGVMYHSVNPLTNAGTAGGTINYTSGLAEFTSWTGAASPTLAVESLLAQVASVPQAFVHGRTPGSPLRPSSFFVRASRYDTGAQVSATADVNGNISTSNMHGYVDIATGVFAIMFGVYVLDSSLTTDEKAEPWYDADNVDESGYVFKPIPIIPGSLRFNCVIQTTLPLDPAIIGINPVRLPLDGRVQMIRAGDTLVIHDTQTDTLTNGLVADDVELLSRTGLNSVVLYDQEGVAVDPALYSVDLAAGEITMANPLDLSAYTQPLVALHTIEDMALCTDAQITGDIAIAQPLTKSYTAANSFVSSALVIGDAQARYERLFELNTWTGDWDAVSGTPPTSGAQYNELTYPIEVLNSNCITQKWRIQFTSSTAFNVVAEELGVIATGTTSGNVAPLNPSTGEPYFTLYAAGFGTGWATGNVIRFNTVAAGAPIWCGRTTRPGPAEVADDLIKLNARWDKD